MYNATIDDYGSVYIYKDTWKAKERFHKTIKLPRAEVLVDIDKDNNILGIEVLNVKLE